MVTMKHRFPQSFSTFACKNYRFFRDFYLGSRLLSLRQAALTYKHWYSQQLMVLRTCVVVHMSSVSHTL